MSDQHDDWVYLDEALPEIHIREIVSIEELLRENPNFVALSNEEIYNQLLLMFRDRPDIADSYFSLHKEVTNPEDRLKRYCRYILYQVNARRKNMGDEEAEQDYFKTLERGNKNPDYKTRQQIKTELQEPYETIGEVGGNDKIAAPRGIKLSISLAQEEDTETEYIPEQRDEGVRLEWDKENYDIVSAEFYKANHADNMYINEHISILEGATRSSIIAKKDSVSIDKLKAAKEDIKQPELFGAFTESVVPSFNHIIRQTNSNNTTDVRSLKILFQLYGRELDEIDAHAYGILIDALHQIVYTEEDQEEKEEQKKKKDKEETGSAIVGKAKEDVPLETSYTKLFTLFWDSLLARLLLAKDAPLYSDVIGHAITTILAKPFKADLYVPVKKQLEGLENGSIKLDAFIKDIQLLKSLDERNLLSEFRQKVQALQEGGDDTFKKLEDLIQKMKDLASITVDPHQAEVMFGSKPFLKTYTDKDATAKKAVSAGDDDNNRDMERYNEEDIVAYVETPAALDEDAEPEEPVDELGLALDKYANEPVAIILKELNDVLTRIKQLTNMPWNTHEIVRMVVQRVPPVIDIGAAMLEIDSSLKSDLVEKVASSSLEEAIDILPIEQHIAVKQTYNKALGLLKKQKESIFFMFIAYWIIQVQSLMLDDLFLLSDITNSPCKSELSMIGYPVQEGREGKKGVMSYFICVMRDDGSDIPNIKELVDSYSKDQLHSMIDSCFAYFTHEIEAMKKIAHTDVVYQGAIPLKEASEAYDTIIKLREKAFKPQDLLKPYIKSLQLLPSIIGDTKDRSKHILGCCFARLDAEYQATKKLKSGLKAARNYFAKERIGQKKRQPLLSYGVPSVPVELPKPEKEANEMFTQGVLENVERDWRDAIRGTSIISGRTRNIINRENRQEVSQLQEEAQRYLDALLRTIGVQADRSIWEGIRSMSSIELVGAIRRVLLTLHKYASNRNNEEGELIRNEAFRATTIVNDLMAEDVPDEENGEIKSVLQYMLCRVACLPGDVEDNKRVITIGRAVRSGLIQELAGIVVKAMRKDIETRSMPTIDEINKKISEIREKRKTEKIRRYEQNPELEKLVKQARLQGISIDVDASPEELAAAAPDRITEDQRADLEGALEFQMPTEDPDETNEDHFNDW